MLVDSQQQPLKTNGSTALTLTLTTASTTFAETSVAVPATFVAVPATWFISKSTAEKGRGASEGADYTRRVSVLSAFNRQLTLSLEQCSPLRR